ncbi:hypothetical protein SCP_1103760 [Sparassis crispa]|uniref:Transcription activator GCR1-like domain-containing protein n=1 Tax=Sparassis crispa TaxID=139825 RepID=A0A401GZZ2_9APHY|nr:hypothetical protein SCP_1103760 [Sparassis crispa]GBE87699.1 hypothetical protein SCP_1103760 [Sparassis crispa]
MNYDNHRDRVKLMHMKNNIAIAKVTHAGRSYAAQSAQAYGVTESGTKAMGGWKENGAFRQCYERTFPVDALLGAANFNGRKPEMYSLPRDMLEPPQEVLSQLFPWVEWEQAALEERARADTRAQDLSLHQFLRVLIWFRRVLLQDAAILCSMEVEEHARHAYRNLPEHLVGSLRGATTTVLLEQQRQYDENSRSLADMSDCMLKMEGLLESFVNSKSRSSCRGRQKQELQATSMTAVVQPINFPLVPPMAPAPVPNITINLAGLPLDVRTGPVEEASQLPSDGIAFRVDAQPSHSAAASSSAHVLTASLQPLGGALHAPNESADPQVVKRVALVQLYGQEVFGRHEPWIWMHGELVPHYRYQPVVTISDVWTEWIVGLNGHISVHELTEKWENRWCHNNTGLKTEGGRQKKIVDLINGLMKKPRWSVNLALLFLKEKYKPRYKVRSFADYLMKDGRAGRDEVVSAAMSYL